MGALSNKGGRWLRNREEIEALLLSCARFDKIAMLRRLATDFN